MEILLTDKLFECLGEAVLAPGSFDRGPLDLNRVELLVDGKLHVHVGDVRLEFTRVEFDAFSAMIADGMAGLIPFTESS